MGINSKTLFCKELRFSSSRISIEAVRLTSNICYRNCQPVSHVVLIKDVPCELRHGDVVNSKAVGNEYNVHATKYVFSVLKGNVQT